MTQTLVQNLILSQTRGGTVEWKKVNWTLALFAWRWNGAGKTIAIPWSRQTSHLAPSPMKTLRQNWSFCIQCRTMAMAAALKLKKNLPV